jgi:hypothetical protein
MPSNTNSVGSLAIPQASVDPTFLYTLNDRLSRIGIALGLTSSSTSSSSSSNSSTGQLTLAKSGILSVQSDVCPSVTLSASQAFTAAVVLLKQKPIGAPVTLQLYVNGVAWGPQLSTTALSTTVDVSSAGAIPANQLVRVDVTGVGASLSGGFPGSDLTVILR